MVYRMFSQTKIYLGLFIILAYNCKVQQQEDCEKRYKENIAYNCLVNNKEGLEFCFVNLLNYNNCKTGNAGKYSNKIEF